MGVYVCIYTVYRVCVIAFVGVCTYLLTEMVQLHEQSFRIVANRTHRQLYRQLERVGGDSTWKEWVEMVS